ncbi:hypothetical protein ACFX2J_033863 [Malus domestica]
MKRSKSQAAAKKICKSVKGTLFYLNALASNIGGSDQVQHLPCVQISKGQESGGKKNERRSISGNLSWLIVTGILLLLALDLRVELDWGQELGGSGLEQGTWTPETQTGTSGARYLA